MSGAGDCSPASWPDSGGRVAAGCDGGRSDGRSALDAQDHPETGRCFDTTWRTGRACDGGPPAASAEVLVAIEPQAVGREKGPSAGPAISLAGATATAIPAARMAGNQRGHEEEGVGGQLQK